MFEWIMKKTKKNNVGKPPVFPKTEDQWSITRSVELIPHFVYSNTENRIIGSIYLTEDQAYNLNQMMRYKGSDAQDLAFLRK